MSLPNPIGSKITAFGAGDLKWIQETQVAGNSIKEAARESRIDSYYELLTEQPLDWESKWDSYYERKAGAKYVEAIGQEEAAPVIEPEDWASSWGDYYTKLNNSPIKNSVRFNEVPTYTDYSFFTYVAPAFASNKYYKNKQGAVLISQG